MRDLQSMKKDESRAEKVANVRALKFEDAMVLIRAAGACFTVTELDEAIKALRHARMTKLEVA